MGNATSFKPGQSGNPAGPPARVLTEKELEVVANLAAKGAKNASFARGLAMSVSLWKTLKLERQPEAIADAIARGESILHDALVSNELRIAMGAEDDRERRMATEFLLASRFQYRTHGEAPIVNVDVGGSGPQLTIIEEVLSPSARALAAALADRNSTNPMLAVESGVAQIRSASESEVELAGAWGEPRRE